MFVDAAEIVAVLGNEVEAARCAEAIKSATDRFTSSIAVWEAAMAVARADKLGLSIPDGFEIVRLFLEEHEIEIRQLPPPTEALALSADAALRFGGRKQSLNIADCFHYACAKHYDAPMLSTADEFRFTDLVVVP